MRPSPRDLAPLDRLTGVAFVCVTLSFVLFSGCGASAPGDAPCESGETQSCACGDESGTQTCEGGAFAACVCGPGSDAGAGDATSDNDAGLPDADDRDGASEDGGASGEDGGGAQRDGGVPCEPLLQWPDQDDDGLGDRDAEPVEDCAVLEGYSLAGTDCDDEDPRVFPTAPELCDERDNDCDTVVDEQVRAVPQWPDSDGDGFGDEDGEIAYDCAELDGFALNDEDCDDESEGVYPGAEDLCDGEDADCDGRVDEAAAFVVYWPDSDDDGYGDAEGVPSEWCSPPDGLVANRDDCDDAIPEISPDAEEVCDLRDNDCDGLIDEGTPLLVAWPDGDDDGYGDAFSAAILSCEPVEGTADRAGDCDDGRPDVNPGEVEVCDGADNDCNAFVDDRPVDPSTFFADVDGDGDGDPENIVIGCEAPEGYVTSGEDCDDRDERVGPGADEVCDTRDNDCDGSADEGVTNACGTCGAEPAEICGDFIDNDCDGAIDEPEDGCFCDGRTNQPCYPAEPQTLGIGVCRGGTVDCACPGGGRFCADGVWSACEGAVTPSVELCNGLDDDCDGAVDEGLRNACGDCGDAPVEVCNGLDDDCDGVADDGVRLPCGVCVGDAPADEVCDGFDSDCDGFVDEGCACTSDEESCYPGPPETVGVGLCRAGVRDCYEGAENASVCTGFVLPSLEVCNGEDDDCDGLVDVDANNCSVCGAAAELCDGIDNDCDGQTDEGLRNSCGDCLADVVPEEAGGLELCDGLDDDCDGFVDEGLINACGTCDEVCYTDVFDDDEEFDEGDGEGIEVDDGLRLNSSSFTYQDLWVANTNDETVTRINTETGEVIGTFSVSYNSGGGNDDPSRTAVDFDGNAWVANRAFDAQGSVVKLRGGDCTEDCVIFRVPIGGFNDRPRGLAIDANGDAWVGTFNGRTVYKLDGETGEVLGSWNVGITVYGLALDREGILWIPTIGGDGIGAFDTNVVDEVEDPMIGRWGVPGCSQPYGIAIDASGNVWTGNWTCGSLVRLDRASFDAGDRPPTMTTYGGWSNTRGVAVDGEGFIWMASSGNNRLVRFNPATDLFDRTFTTCGNPIGVGIANDGRIWSMCNNSDRAQRFDTDAGLVTDLDVGDAPYSYSDMTGFQLRNFVAPRGTWSTTFDCAFDECSFDGLRWESEEPAGTAVAMRVRSSEDDASYSPWSASFTESPADIRDEVPHGRYLEIEVTMTADGDVSPVLRSFDVDWQRP